MPSPTITKDNGSNINVQNANLIVTGSVTSSEYIGDGSKLSNISLQRVTDIGNSTDNTLILNNSLITGNVASQIKVINETMTINMGEK